MKQAKSLVVMLLLAALLLAACGGGAPAPAAEDVVGEAAEEVAEETVYEPLPDEAYEPVDYQLYPAPEGGYVGDVMPFVTEDGTLELYYLFDTDSNGQGYHPIYKYSTDDLCGYEDHGMVLSYGMMSDPDPALGTGCVMQDADGLYHLFYTGHNDTGNGGMGNVGYCTTKGAVEMLTKAFAADLRPNIQVNAIGPNITYTPMMVGLLPPDEETRNKIADGLPARRIGYEIDVVGVALFLASAASDMVTATTIYPDGGLVATS